MGGGGADSTHSQTVFFIPSIRDTAEQQNLATFSKMGNMILNIKMTNFHPESRGMTISGKSPCQKVVELHLYCHNV